MAAVTPKFEDFSATALDVTSSIEESISTLKTTPQGIVANPLIQNSLQKLHNLTTQAETYKFSVRSPEGKRLNDLAVKITNLVRKLEKMQPATGASQAAGLFGPASEIHEFEKPTKTVTDFLLEALEAFQQPLGDIELANRAHAAIEAGNITEALPMLHKLNDSDPIYRDTLTHTIENLETHETNFKTIFNAHLECELEYDLDIAVVTATAEELTKAAKDSVSQKALERLNAPIPKKINNGLEVLGQLFNKYPKQAANFFKKIEEITTEQKPENALETFNCYITSLQDSFSALQFLLSRGKLSPDFPFEFVTTAHSLNNAQSEEEYLALLKEAYPFVDGEQSATIIYPFPAIENSEGKTQNFIEAATDNPIGATNLPEVLLQIGKDLERSYVYKFNDVEFNDTHLENPTIEQRGKAVEQWLKQFDLSEEQRINLLCCFHQGVTAPVIKYISDKVFTNRGNDSYEGHFINASPGTQMIFQYDHANKTLSIESIYNSRNISDLKTVAIIHTKTVVDFSDDEGYPSGKAYLLYHLSKIQD